MARPGKSLPVLCHQEGGEGLDLVEGPEQCHESPALLLFTPFHLQFWPAVDPPHTLTPISTQQVKQLTNKYIDGTEGSGATSRLLAFN
jgi:hypothetical protein